MLRFCVQILSQVINYETQFNCLDIVFEHARCVFCWCVAADLQMMYKFVVCKSTRLGKTIHAFSNISKHHAVAYDVAQFVFMHNFFRYHYKRYDHVLIPFPLLYSGRSPLGPFL